MNVCFFILGLTEHYKGGLEIYSENLIKSLSKRGIDVTVITTALPNGIRFQRKWGVNIYYADGSPFKLDLRFIHSSMNIFKSLTRKKKIDIIHSQGIGGVGFTYHDVGKIPIILTMHGTALNSFIGDVKANPKSFMSLFKYIRLYENFEKPLVKIADKVIAVSSILKSDIVRQYLIDESKVTFIPAGVRNTNGTVQRNKAKKDDKVLVVSGGRLIRGKGFEDVVRLFYYLDNFEPSKFRFIIYGEGPLKSRLISLVKGLRMDKKIDFVGFIDNDSIHKFLLDGDIFVFMSKLKEGLPLSISDAMSAGLVVFSLRTGGVVDLIRDGETGFIINSKNLKKTALFIIEKIKNKKLLQVIGENARKDILSKFTLEQMTKRHIKLYREILASFND